MVHFNQFKPWGGFGQGFDCLSVAASHNTQSQMLEPAMRTQWLSICIEYEWKMLLENDAAWIA